MIRNTATSLYRVPPFDSHIFMELKLQRQQLLHQQLLQFPPHVAFVSLQHAKTLLYRARWTCNVLQTMCRDTCGS